jgi:hypothetical protein
MTLATVEIVAPTTLDEILLILLNFAVYSSRTLRAQTCNERDSKGQSLT